MMNFSGHVKNAKLFTTKTNKRMISFTAADEFGNTFPFQMWDDDQQFDALAAVVDQMRRQPVQCVVMGYSNRVRDLEDGSKRAQLNLVVSSVVLPALQQQPSGV